MQESREDRCDWCDATIPQNAVVINEHSGIVTLRDEHGRVHIFSRHKKKETKDELGEHEETESKKGEMG